jgi:hypothetical protein
VLILYIILDTTIFLRECGGLTTFGSISEHFSTWQDGFAVVEGGGGGISIILGQTNQF